jgi:hypothetical protein
MTSFGRKTRIEIDLNARTEQGYTWASISDADGPVALDDKMIVYQDELAGLARVVGLSQGGQFVTLAVDWESVTDDAEDVFQDTYTISFGELEPDDIGGLSEFSSRPAEPSGPQVQTPSILGAA